MASGSPTTVSCISLLVIGLGLAAIFPCLMSQTPHRLGRETAVHAIGFQIAAATLGAATIPGLTGLAIEHFGVHVVAVIAVCVALSLFTVHESMLWIHRQKNSVIANTLMIHHA